MSRPKTEVNPVSAERLRQMVIESGLSQTAFGNKIPLSQQAISDICNKKNALTLGTARDIINAYPDYELDWLLGFSPYPTVKAKEEAAIRFYNATENILDSIYGKGRNDYNDINTVSIHAALGDLIVNMAEIICRESGDNPNELYFNPDAFAMLTATIFDITHALTEQYVEKCSHQLKLLTQIKNQKESQIVGSRSTKRHHKGKDKGKTGKSKNPVSAEIQ